MGSGDTDTTRPRSHRVVGLVKRTTPKPQPAEKVELTTQIDLALQLEHDLTSQVESLVSTYKPRNSQEISRDDADKVNAGRRIPPMSSGCFMYLRGTLAMPRPKSRRKTPPTSPTRVKAEPLTISLEKGLHDADIIYDLSDYEEDERFYSRIKTKMDSMEDDLFDDQSELLLQNDKEENSDHI